MPTSPAPTPTPTLPDLQREVAELADRLRLTEPADRLLAATQPALTSDAARLRDACRASGIPAPEGRLLGCFTSDSSGKRIHVWDVRHPELQGTNEVTLAHELLHAAWHAMEPAERSRLEPDLRQVFDQGEPADRLELLGGYRDRDADVFVNELHSYLGTEVATLTPLLEDHYATVFTDRQVVVEYSESSTAELKRRAADLEARDDHLASESARIDAEKETLRTRSETRRAEAAALGVTLEELDTRDPAAVAGYNRQVDEHNERIAEDRRLQDALTEAIAAHNAAVEEQRRLVAELDTLQELRGVTRQ